MTKLTCKRCLNAMGRLVANGLPVVLERKEPIDVS